MLTYVAIFAGTKIERGKLIRTSFGKLFYFNITIERDVSNVGISNFVAINVKLFSSFKVSWYEARDWCSERGMFIATLKTLSEMQAVSKGFLNRGLGKSKA